MLKLVFADNLPAGITSRSGNPRQEGNEGRVEIGSTSTIRHGSPTQATPPTQPFHRGSEEAQSRERVAR